MSQDNVSSNNVKQLCGFKIGKGHYAVEVLDVQEVVKPQNVTPVPLGPDYIDGLINLRGQIVTAINIENSKFEDTPDTIDKKISSFINGVYKLEDKLITLLSLEKILSLEMTEEK